MAKLIFGPFLNHPVAPFSVAFNSFKDERDLQAYLVEHKARIGKQAGTISAVEITKKETKSPSLFSLSSLQKKANTIFKLSAKETLKTVQALYEAKLLTYPRTDTPYITHNEFTYLRKNISNYLNFLGITEKPTQLEPRKSYVNDSKVQEHHAIILTKTVATKEVFDKLTLNQKNIYLLVAKTTVGMFLPNYKYEETVIQTAVGNLLLKSKGQVPLEQGWKILFTSLNKKEKENEVLLPKVQKGQSVQVDLEMKEKETQPPKPYNEGSIIIAMKTAGKTVDDEVTKNTLNEVEGIGTEATRADVIETLKKREYILSQKNQLVITEKGRLLCQAVSNQALLTSAEMTAKWEVYLKKIGQSQGSQEVFLNNIKKFITHLIEAVPEDISKLPIESYKEAEKREIEKSIVGNCPTCGGNMILKKTFYGCSNYPNCKFTMANNFRGKKLSKKNIKELLEGKEIVVNKIKKKESKDTYNAQVKLNEKGFITFLNFAK
ncbi:topoisomerase DNA-binding C4 zinc finger domain-containing protein [Enterococcus sp. ALS3]|uniref:Topoisomerase DNA-binding C4 zinc finger domain-containing protein n=1 Tax=Enterococcus alishanensis TaxID=1303817 RepID=A0ABS6THI3_9ENTE|nr:type IA DNA topoisomerase [Enterococcus alishanensis]MBV7392390.1 topoisomerase DNA-binding C4 zinc finger domain-containing protein [Enterococcus alishanensis]